MTSTTTRPVPSTTTPAASRWRPVCAARSLPKGGAIGLHVAGHPVAVFRTCDGELFALADVDPEADAPLSTGQLASRRDVPVVVGPSGRRFELARGVCVAGGAAVASFPVRVTDGAVEVALPAA